MDYLKEFNEIMKSQDLIALATSKGDISNVRLVNFYYDTKERIVYFTSFKGCNKNNEFTINNIVSFTTIPVNEGRHVRIKNGIVRKSLKKPNDLIEEFVSKDASFRETIPNAKDSLELFEVIFDKALVTLGMDGSEEIQFETE